MGNVKEIDRQLAYAKADIEKIRKRIRGKTDVSWYAIGSLLNSARYYLNNADLLAQGKKPKRY